MRIKLILIPLLFIVQGLMLVGFAMSAKKPEVCLIDLKTTQAQFIRQLAEQAATDSQIALASRQFKQNLRQTLISFSKKHKAIILDRQTVLSGGRDVTEDIAKALSAAMRKKP